MSLEDCLTMANELSPNGLLGRADKHRLCVTHRRDWPRFWTQLSYLRCLCRDLKIGPLPSRKPVQPG